MKVIIFAGSLREKSLNKKLCKFIAKEFQSNEVQFFEEDLKSLKLPVYDQDIEDESGIPESALKFSERIKNVDALIISSPEYNGSISSPLKNTIDWLSRIRPDSIRDRKILLVGASPGALGAVQGLWHSRQPLEKMGAYVFPRMFGLPKAAEAFSADGDLLDPVHNKNLKGIVEAFLNWSL